jgi:hypothetical protein
VKCKVIEHQNGNTVTIALQIVNESVFFLRGIMISSLSHTRHSIAVRITFSACNGQSSITGPLNCLWPQHRYLRFHVWRWIRRLVSKMFLVQWLFICFALRRSRKALRCPEVPLSSAGLRACETDCWLSYIPLFLQANAGFIIYRTPCAIWIHHPHNSTSSVFFYFSF